MNWKIAVVGAVGCAQFAAAAPPLRDPVALNIGINCQWQRQCMTKHRQAMKRAIKLIEVRKIPGSLVALCNRNAGRRGYRVDWIGFDNCIRNATLLERVRASSRHKPRQSGSPAPPPAPNPRSGERG